MTAKHTPAPWRIEGRFVMAMKTKSICEIPMGGVIHGKVDKANARLIAAAPDLLQALKDMLANCYDEERDDFIFQAVKNARAAIAMASEVQK